MSKEQFIAVDIWGDFAHFSHPSTVYSSITYPVPPKSAVIGFLGAVCGKTRKEYREWLGEFYYAVSILNPIRKIKLSFNGIPNILNMTYYKKGWMPSSKYKAKQFYRELIVQPKFRIFLKIENQNVRNEARDFLSSHKSCYTPYLGINSCIADFNYLEIGKAELITDDFFNANTMIEQKFYSDTTEIEEQRLASQIMPFDIAPHERIFLDFKETLVELKGNPLRTKNNQNSWAIKIKNEKISNIFLC
ncbi:MAG: CRISPR-associated protein Cas5 [Campylobacteraceae bacterium]|jgi:CRISPR-associated protein Cas5h|nr:CRISPR-associated protein Cas5 [Campylobacteraceae bacterium]